MVGLNKFTDKERRKQRRSFQSNHIAVDLHSSKYRQRTVSNKKKHPQDWDEEEDDT
jgi:hypothetical protein